MNNINALVTGKKRTNIPLIFLYAYVVLSFITLPLKIDDSWQRIFMWLMISIPLISTLFDINRFKLMPYHFWYLLLVLLAFISTTYSIDSNNSFNSIYTLLVPLGLTFSILLVIKTYKEIEKVLICFSMSGLVLFIILFLTNQLQVDERLGQTLFGNANTFASIVMISLISSIWLAENSRSIVKLFYILISLMQAYLIFLSGGRKYIFTPLIFLFLIFLLKKDKILIRKIFVILIKTLGICVIGYFLVMNIPTLYNSMGYRLEELLGFFIGQDNGTISDLNRVDYISKGFEYFLQSPIWGWGNNSFMILYGRQTGVYVYSHNNFIEILTNFGAIGFLLYYSLYAYLIKKLWDIENDETNLRNFFLAFIVSLVFLETGLITYYIVFIMIILSLAGWFVYKKSKDKVLQIKVLK